MADRSGLVWQHTYASDLAYAAPAWFHVDTLEWFAALAPGERPAIPAWVLVVFRGGAKSASAETGVAFTAARRTRRYILYVSRTQDLADGHVRNIGTILANPLIRHDYPHMGGVRVRRLGDRDIWRRNRIRTGGVTIDALGLDVNVRGARLDQYRPDLIVIDDVDARHDSRTVAAKNIETLTESVIGLGSEHLAVAVIQNQPNDHGFVARLVTGEASYLADRRLIGPIPAVEGLAYRSEPTPEGPNLWRITDGTPTWPAGYPLARAEQDLNLSGPEAFEAERQHNRQGAGGHFDPEAWAWCDPEEIPAGVRWCRGWDFAASASTKNDRTGSVLMGRAPNGKFYIRAASAGWWTVSEVEARLVATTRDDGYDVWIDLPRDPAQAGKDQAERRAAMLAGYPVHVTNQTGSKLVRATGLIAQQQAGNVVIVRAAWGLDPMLAEVRAECDAFTGQDGGHHDDLVDAASAAFNRLAGSHIVDEPTGRAAYSGLARTGW